MLDLSLKFLASLKLNSEIHHPHSNSFFYSCLEACGYTTVSHSTNLSGILIDHTYLPGSILLLLKFYGDAKVIGKGVPRRHLFLFSSLLLSSQPLLLV